ncbi:hypothetical protein J2X55_000032 [Microbacterium sp. 1154]|uniref:hypothetical protein n=1 Tax=Microbacterium sp. 1154 TaxID=2817733 RepID=UPI00285EF9F0|nr:hypothetical protein [Microbacterium sp. 1154]MDR6689133.1 hypothetical protein [Microbacterium sp. 1154]
MASSALPEIHLPMIRDDAGDLTAHLSISGARQYVEAADVEDGVYEAFDATGRRLRLYVDGEVVRMVPATDAEPDEGELRRRLISFFERLSRTRPEWGVAGEPSLQHLVDRLLTLQA